ncbi:beta-propeller domain-containing protein [bacterium]|nr:beta-propeller domain-containing protein [bacterium]
MPKKIKKPSSRLRQAEGKNSGLAKFINRFGNTPIFIMFLLLVSAIGLVVIISSVKQDNGNNYIQNLIKPGTPVSKYTANYDIEKFKSSEDFQNYLKLTEGTEYFAAQRNMAAMPMATEDFAMQDTALKGESGIGFGGGGPDRISETNVQVAGIDEPDIVKTDGQEIYFANRNRGTWIDVDPMPREDIMVDSFKVLPGEYKSYTHLINAWPPKDLAEDSKIDFSGDLLLSEGTLLVMDGRKINGYDVTDPTNPAEIWNLNLDKNHYIVTSRLYQGKLYLVTRSAINRNTPCPIPLFEGDQQNIVSCVDIYHPVAPLPVNTTYTTMIIDAQNGQLEKSLSFVGTSGSSVVYMSADSIYITYDHGTNMFEFMFNFLKSETKDLMPANLVTKLNRLSTYELSIRAKMTELEIIMEEWLNSIDRDEELRISTEIENRMVDYSDKHKRDIQTTGIIRIDTDNLKVKASGSVPGTLLNQFSLDEYDGYLRVATTIGGRSMWGFGRSNNSANDIYILDSNLKKKGVIEDLGLTERIYSARFIGDRGYLVTFRQIDPFYILDLSDPKNPQMTGELKIPGYSSYLHPISENKILGIGMEDRKVKLSYFDVSNPKEPKEIDKYMLSDYGSEALNNHHAFLMDAKHQIFFLPSYSGGFIFSYANDKLQLVRAVSLQDVKRAVYLDNYLYIIASDYIAVLNENDWEKVNGLELN